MAAEPNDVGPNGGLTPRQSEIVKLVQEHGFVTIEALAKQFDVSGQTVRRDIIRLEDAKLLQRFHGGAGLLENTVRLGYAEKRALASDSKERIGRAVADLVPDGSSLFLDVGTTVEAVARALRFKSRLHVFTCSLPAATILSGQDGIEVFVTGGSIKGPDGSLVGETAVSAISMFKADYAVFGCSGFDEDGTVMDFDLQKVAVKRAMLANCRVALLATDASKFERSAIVRIAALSAFSKVVTDIEPPRRLLEAIESSGLSLVVA